MDQNPITLADDVSWAQQRMGTRTVPVDVASRLLTEVAEGRLDAALALRKLLVLSTPQDAQ